MHMRGRGDWRFLLRQKAKGRRQKTKVRNELTLPNCSLDLEHRDLPKKTLASIAFLTFAFCLCRRSLLRRRRSHHRVDTCGDEGAHADVSRTRRCLSAAHRRV